MTAWFWISEYCIFLCTLLYVSLTLTSLTQNIFATNCTSLTQKYFATNFTSKFFSNENYNSSHKLSLSNCNNLLQHYGRAYFVIAFTVVLYGLCYLHVVHELQKESHQIRSTNSASVNFSTNCYDKNTLTWWPSRSECRLLDPVSIRNCSNE